MKKGMRNINMSKHAIIRTCADALRGALQHTIHDRVRVCWHALLVILIGTACLLPIGTTHAAQIDSPLEASIERFVKRYRRSRQLVSTDLTSFVVYDISRRRKLVSINEDQPRMAASLVKNFVMLAYFHEVRQGRKAHTNYNRSQLRRMIQKSSNPATNYFIRLLGGPRRVQRILKANYPYFQQTRIVEYIPAGGRTYRNMTSAHDLNRFYVQLWYGNLPHSQKMKYYLKLPNGDYIFKKTHIPASVKVYNKTGTVYGLVADSGILVFRDSRGKARPYVFTGMIQDRTKTNRRNRYQSFGTWVTRRANILRRVSEKAYGYLANH